MTNSKERKFDFSFDKHTKIICTLGPSSSSEKVLEKLIIHGMNVARLNMSHGDFEEQYERIVLVRKISKKLGKPVSILLDTKGPEIRTHEFMGGKASYKVGDKLFIECGKEIVGTKEGFSVSYKELASTVKPGDEILCDDGKLSLKVLKLDGTKVYCESQNAHIMKNKKAINIPGAILKLPFVSKYDKKAIEWGLDNDVDYIAASFVNCAKDVLDIKKIIKTKNKENVQIISKIESLQAVRNLNGIILASDGIMLARGDLGVEIPFEQVPFYQKLITNKCKFFGKPIIIATQMLESMSENPRPTRSEVTDVYFAVDIGVDATMLSGESAAGDFPIESVQAMSKINFEAEKNFNYQLAYEQAFAYVPSLNARISYEVAKKVLDEKIEYIVALSEKGNLIKSLSKFRPNAKIIGVTNKTYMYTYFGVWYGVYMNKVLVNPRFLFDNDVALNKILKSWKIKSGRRILVCEKDKYRIIQVK